jgi:hypothetical protein
MSWETRGSGQHTYYYRVQRNHQGRLTKTYYRSAVAQRAAQEDNHQRALRQQARLAQQQVHDLETQLTTLTNVVRTFVAASFWGCGFHRHASQWRKRRCLTHHQQEGALVMPEFPVPVESGTSYDSLKILVEQAQQGDTTILPIIRTLLDQVPELWDDSRVLAHQVERSWVHALSGQDLLSKEIIEREVEGLRSQLLGPHPTPLEKLLVDRICVCWLAVQHSELHAAKRFNERAVVLTPSEENRLDKVHHRFLTAVRELARVRKLLQPTTKFQVNIGTNQVVA